MLITECTYLCSPASLNQITCSARNLQRKYRIYMRDLDIYPSLVPIVIPKSEDCTASPVERILPFYFINNSYKRLSHAFAQHFRNANGTYVVKIRPNAMTIMEIS